MTFVLRALERIENEEHKTVVTEVPVYFVGIAPKKFKDLAEGEKLTTYEPKVEIKTTTDPEEAMKFSKYETASAYLGRYALSPLGFGVWKTAE